MSSQRMPAPERAGPAERAPGAGLALAVLAVVILLFTFRGLAIITLPLSAVALLLSAWGAATAVRLPHRFAAIAGLVLALLALLVSVAALAANLAIPNGYDVY